MKDEQLEDLKEFIQTTVGQTETRLGERLDALEQKVDDGFAGVGEAIEVINNRIDQRPKSLNKTS